MKSNVEESMESRISRESCKSSAADSIFKVIKCTGADTRRITASASVQIERRGFMLLSANIAENDWQMGYELAQQYPCKLLNGSLDGGGEQRRVHHG